MPLLVVQAFRQVEQRNADCRKGPAGLDGQRFAADITRLDHQQTRGALYCRLSELSVFTGRQRTVSDVEKSIG
jgi:hypothetical protein